MYNIINKKKIMQHFKNKNQSIFENIETIIMIVLYFSRNKTPIILKIN